MTDNRQDPIREWLGAYLDGELNADRRAWVEEHLAACEGCRAELRALRALGDLLHADPEPVFAPGRARRPLPALPARPVEREINYHPGALRWVPLGLFGLWAFFQAAVTASGIFLIGEALLPVSGLPAFPGAAILLPLGWINMLLEFFGLGDLPDALAAAFPVLSLLLLELLFTAVIAVLFLSWLAGVYSHRRSVLLAARD